MPGPTHSEPGDHSSHSHSIFMLKWLLILFFSLKEKYNVQNSYQNK